MTAYHLREIAERVAAKFRKHAIAPTPEAVRDAADFASQCDLDCLQLDLLCDMIAARLARETV